MPEGCMSEVIALDPLSQPMFKQKLKLTAHNRHPLAVGDQALKIPIAMEKNHN